MTALNQYQRLEASGQWRETPTGALREVVVSFGDATLVLADPRSDMPLAHWSLPAVIRLNPGEMPARYAPAPEDAEMLEVDDALMIGAIEKVHRAIEASKPARGRLRGGLTLGAIAAMLVTGLFWVPPALVRHAADIAPPAQRAEIGRMILDEIERSTGSACSRPAGDMVRGRLAARLIGPDAEIAVLPAVLRGARRLPGPITVIGEDLVEGQVTPEVAAGHILAAQAAALENDPLLDALRYAGPRATFHLLTKGSLPRAALAGYGEALLARAPSRPRMRPCWAISPVRACRASPMPARWTRPARRCWA